MSVKRGIILLLGYKFKNFKSFKYEVDFSMEAPSGKVKRRYPDNYVSLNYGKDILKTAVIVGENAGGKTNFVESLEYFRLLFKENNHVKTSMPTVNTNNIKGRCLKENNTEQVFEISLSGKDDKVFNYTLVIDALSIWEERLNVSDKKTHKKRIIFEYQLDNRIYECDDKQPECDKKKCHTSAKTSAIFKLPDDYPETISAVIEESFNSGNDIGLFVSKLALLGVSEAVEFIEIIRDQLCPETPSVNLDLYKSLNKEEDDLRILKDKNYFDIFRMIDYSIVSIDINEDEPFTESIVCRKNYDGHTFKRKIGRDSSGVREFFAWAIQIYKVVYENKIVIADEMDRVLNPVLSDRIIAYINGSDHKGQFIFTSHNALHLNLVNYMKEQIYFITKDTETLESELYSLADFREIRYENTKVYELYMKGLLGGTASE